jgi:uncharacterized protein YoxC
VTNFGLPRPSAVLRVADQGLSTVTQALGLLPRMVTLTGQLEQLIARADELMKKIDDDILPVVASLHTVPADIHDLLDTSKDLNDIVGSVPGLRHVQRRIDSNQRLQDEEWASNIDSTQRTKDGP